MGADSQKSNSNVIVKVCESISMPAESSLGGTFPRSGVQLSNALFKFENCLRDMVLSLSDRLEDIDMDFKAELIQKIDSINPQIGQFLHATYLQSNLRQNNEFNGLGLRPVEAWMLNDILSKRPPAPAYVDYRLSHEELFNRVRVVHSSEQSRGIFLQEIIQFLGYAMQQGTLDTATVNELSAFSADLVRALTFLSSDKMATAKKELIKQALDGVNELQATFSHSLRMNVVESWPAFEVGIPSNKTLSIKAFLSFDYSKKDVEVGVNSPGTKIYVMGSGIRKFFKIFDSFEPVKSDSIQATLQKGILEIKAKLQ
jgi:hypothetical protein